MADEKATVATGSRDKAVEYALKMHQNRDYAVEALIADARVIDGFLTGSTDPVPPVESASGITFDKNGKQLTGPTAH